MVNESQCFISFSCRLNEIRVSGVPVFQRLFVSAQLEEIVFFGYVLYRSTVNWTISVIQISFAEIGLTADAIQAFVCLKVNVAVVIAGLQQLLHSCIVSFFARSDEIVIRYLELVPSVLKSNYRSISPFDWGTVIFFSCTLNLKSVLIGPGEKVDITP